MENYYNIFISMLDEGYTHQLIGDVYGFTVEEVVKITGRKPLDTDGRECTRSKVRQRDNHTCQSCLKKWVWGERRFDVHHLDGVCGKKSRGYDREADIDKLITLCHKCHYNHHQFSMRLDGKWKEKKLFTPST